MRFRALLLGVAFEGGMIVLGLPLCWLLGVPPLGVGFSWEPAALLRAVGLGLAATLPMLLVFLVLHHWPIEPFVRIRAFFDEVLLPLFSESTVLDLALICVLAGVGEEILFRAAIQAGLAGYLGPWGALVAASLIFGLVHPITRAYVVLAAGLGAYLGLLWLLTENLLVVSLAHGLYDFIVMLVLLRKPVPKTL
jgi:membrane protease YdiL (CAAX protease family)